MGQPFLLTISKLWAGLLRKYLKTEEKLKEFELMHQNAIYICISWYNKICWSPVKKCWCQQKSGGVSRDSYNFLIFFREGITVPSFIILRYLWQILGRGPFWPPHPWAAPKMPILNRVKITENENYYRGTV